MIYLTTSDMPSSALNERQEPRCDDPEERWQIRERGRESDFEDDRIHFPVNQG
jgi:hypothetical protein